jgi:hypothetical protein
VRCAQTCITGDVAALKVGDVVNKHVERFRHRFTPLEGRDERTCPRVERIAFVVFGRHA